MSKEDIKKIINNAELVQQNLPVPLLPDLPSSEPYPIDSFGKLLKDASLAIGKIAQCPLEICCQSVLAVASLATQGHGNILLPNHQTAKPISEYFLTIASSGERKSTCDELALKGIRDYEKELKAKESQEFCEFLNKKEIWEFAKNEILKDKKRSKEEKEADLKNLGLPPTEPPLSLIVHSDGTYEGTVKSLKRSLRSIGIFSDEAATLIGGYSMSEENRLRSSAGFSSLWDRGEVKRVRATQNETLFLSDKRLTMHLMAQPSVMLPWLSNVDLQGQGIFSRLLMVYPESKIGKRKYKEADHEAFEKLSYYQERTKNLLERSNANNEIHPIRLSEGAKRSWINFVNDIEHEMGEGRRLANVRNFVNKSSEHVCRIGAILTIFEDSQAIEITEDTLDMAISLIRYNISEILRINGSLALPKDLSEALKLINWLLYNWEEDFISIPDIQQNSAIRDNSFLKKKIIPMLEEHNYLIPLHEPATIKGQMRRNVFKINKL